MAAASTPAPRPVCRRPENIKARLAMGETASTSPSLLKHSPVPAWRGGM
jgi:hypothetical protein